MRYKVTGKHIDIGDSLRTHVEASLGGVVEKFARRPTDATVIFSKDAHEFVCEATLHLSTGLNAQARAHANEIYSAFDKIAYRHGVFKVETVGDCYVAAAGLPDPNEEHAILACRFARSCLKAMKEITLQLEVSLGPDTADLDLRIGMHRYVLYSVRSFYRAFRFSLCLDGIASVGK